MFSIPVFNIEEEKKGKKRKKKEKFLYFPAEETSVKFILFNFWLIFIFPIANNVSITVRIVLEKG